MDKELKVKTFKTAVLILTAVICIFGLCKPMTSVEIHKESIKSLDEKKDTVMKLAAGSTAASVAVSMLPGDTATPVADKLADLSFYFVIILSAIYLEKYLLTLTGYAAFMFLIPLACIILTVYVWIGNERFKYLAKKMIAFGMLLFLIIPVSVKVSDIIESTYGVSIENTIESVQKNTEEVPQNKKEKEIFPDFRSKVENDISFTTDKFEKIFNDLMESIAVMLVTSCLVPVLILVFFIWLIKMYLNVPGSIESVYMKKKLWKSKTSDEQNERFQ